MNPIGTKRISRPQNGVISNEPIEIWHNHGFYLRTVVYVKSVLKGSQWVVFIPRVEHTPLQDVGNELLIYLAVMVKPL